MHTPQEQNDKHDSYVGYLRDYNDGLLTMEPYVPFWMRVYIENLDLIDSEPDADLERIKAFILEEPTYERLNGLYDILWEQMAAAQGPEFYVDTTPLGRKYGVILNLLEGLRPKPFYAPEWEVCFACYALDAFDLNDAKQAILDERIKASLTNFEPYNE